jgi:hypothetical protein
VHGNLQLRFADLDGGASYPPIGRIPHYQLVTPGICSGNCAGELARIVDAVFETRWLADAQSLTALQSETI